MESRARAEQASKWHCSLFDPSPTDSATTQQRGLPCPGEYVSPAPYNITGVLRQRNMAQMKEQMKTPEKEVSDEKIVNLSDAEFKTLVIRKLTELIKLGRKMKEQMKATQSKIKQNIQ